MNKEKASDVDGLSFEEALKQLEDLVQTLEGGETPLEASIQAYTRGMGLVRHCMAKLEKAETTLKLLAPKEEGFELIDSPLPGDDDSEHV